MILPGTLGRAEAGDGQVECTDGLGYSGRLMATESTNVVVVMVTAANQDEAGKIAEHVVRTRLAACASTLPAIHSTYWWEGKVMNEQESLVLIKTTSDKFTVLQDAIRKIHSYKVPEIIALPVVDGLPLYLEWVCKETS